MLSTKATPFIKRCSSRYAILLSLRRGLRGLRQATIDVNLKGRPVIIEHPTDPDLVSPDALVKTHPPPEDISYYYEPEYPTSTETSITHQVLGDTVVPYKPLPSLQEIKRKHLMFDPPRDRCYPPYVKDQSIEAASINKQLFHLYPSEKTAEVWPSIREERRARRKLPVPISLTGLGLDDGTTAKYWTLKLKRSFEKIERLAEADEVKSDNFLENVPPSVEVMLKSLGEGDMSKDHMELKKLYESALETERNKDNQVAEEEIVQFPHQIRTAIRERVDKEVLQVVQETRQELLDTEYDQYMKHHKVLNFMAKGLNKPLSQIEPEEYDAEMEAWRETFWRRSYGSANPTIAPSNVPCGGCGAKMHCTDPAIPGYIPSEKFIQMSDTDLKREVCQRCEFMDHFNVSLDVTVDPEEYPKILAELQSNKSIVILMVDLLDFPCSIWPDIVHLIGRNRKVFVVGNKVDLLPKDGKDYLERVKETLKKSLFHAGFGGEYDTHWRNISLISAKTGFGVESLITRILHAWNGQEDVYLIGCTNVGKSTLFNSLLQSDLCALRENDLIQRATTSVWPGTTLNLLKFPIKRLEGWQMQKRLERLRWQERVKAEEHILRKTIWKQTGNASQPQIIDRVNMTFRQEVPFTVESGHPFAKRHVVPKPFNENDPIFAGAQFVCDSPGTIYKDQILDLLTTEELLKTVPRRVITPRTFTIQPYQTLFVGGLARIDVIHARQNVHLTVFSSDYMPVHVVYTQEARRFYELFVGSQLLGVPFGGPERMSHWPSLIPREIDVKGISWTESCADIVLSSAGWVSVTIGIEEEAVLKAFTPGGRGCFVRTPSLLPFAVNMRGRRIPGTPCFTVRGIEIEDFADEDYREKEKIAAEYRWKKKHAIGSFRTRD